MNGLALSLYAVAAVADISGICLAFVDLRSRTSLLAEFRIPEREPPPMIYNEHPRLTRWLAAQGPQATEQRLAEGFNEVIGALIADRATTDVIDAQLATLQGIGSKTWRLWLAFALLLLGTVLGAAGNLVSSAGVGT